MLKNICSFCGGRCETIGGPDGNPFHKNRQEMIVCTACGRTISESYLFQISEDELKELLMDADTIVDDIIIDHTTEVDISVDDIIHASDNLKLKISATAEGGGGKQNAEITVPITDGVYSLGNDYPFGRRDVDQKPPFSLCNITVNGNEISIAGEIVGMKELPKTITKKLTAYGYGYVPWEETITITICIK